ncbi:hypothetical protein N1851_026432 [Merluccius polli]|uniref:Peptidase A2 domain-containing protein n=1 Tax=Merluccius polli TaxID=89951 RepID=A0AA47MBS8_MERPO|nr:hypothetical protein N1851_026432 [Merluccius polli]
MSTKGAKVSDSPASALRVEPSTTAPNNQKPYKATRASDVSICYRCGNKGTSPTNVRMQRIRAKLFKSSFSLLRGLRQDRHLAKKTRALILFASVIKVPPSVVPLRVNGHQCDAVLDSGSQVTIIFETWYKQHLSDVLIHPVSGLAIWGLSETSYPYLGYVVVEVEFPERVSGSKESISVLALICPGQAWNFVRGGLRFKAVFTGKRQRRNPRYQLGQCGRGIKATVASGQIYFLGAQGQIARARGPWPSWPSTPDQIPVILGTNASLFKRLAKICKEAAAETLGIRVDETVQNTTQVTCEGEDIGCIQWMGPGPLTLPAGEECRAVCCVKMEKPLDNEVLMVDASPTDPLLAGVLLQPMVVPSSEVMNHFRVVVRNESVRDTVLPVGTVMEICVLLIRNDCSTAQVHLKD